MKVKRSSKKRSSKERAHRVHAVFSAFSVSIVLLFAAIMVVHAALWGRIPPGTMIGKTNVSLMTKTEAKTKLTTDTETVLQTPRTLLYREKQTTFTPKTLGVRYDAISALERIPTITPEQSLLRFFHLIAQKRTIPLPMTIDSARLSAQILETFSITETPPTNATLHSRGNTLIIKPDEKGFVLDFDALQQKLQSDNTHPITITLREVLAERKARDWEPVLPRLQKVMEEPLIITWNDLRFSINLRAHPDWYIPAGDAIALQEEKVQEYIEKEIAKKIDIAPVAAKIRRDPTTNMITIDAHAKKGTRMARSLLLAKLEDAINKGEHVIKLPVDVVQPSLDIDPELQARGIHELIGVGYTDFRGSPPNRINNIAIGLARYNGFLIPPGATFSFNDNLGPVTAKEGYRPELVIKPEGTIPEYGGGLCQVSSTMFRAALFTGFPIVERFPHSFAVPYYARPGGQGLDATIYPGSKDLKFFNDTEGHVLLQTFIEGTDAYVNVFGTGDGRMVEMSDFKTWGWTKPPEPIIAETPDLQPGVKKEVDKEHAGLSASWIRRITKNGETKEETIRSRYNPWPARYLVGAATGAAEEKEGVIRVTEGALPLSQ